MSLADLSPPYLISLLTLCFQPQSGFTWPLPLLAILLTSTVIGSTDVIFSTTLLTTTLSRPIKTETETYTYSTTLVTSSATIQTTHIVTLTTSQTTHRCARDHQCHIHRLRRSARRLRMRRLKGARR
ncbi:hypothetical protein M422DRAFT_243978 [Sphaerobolus stellatus SS14]|nr:hypothetical protein M422DRAFT_243978 [Sphaerobolus stellatus SS14]